MLNISELVEMASAYTRINEEQEEKIMQLEEDLHRLTTLLLYVVQTVPYEMLPEQVHTWYITDGIHQTGTVIP